MPPTDTISGGCLCGAIRYEIDIAGPSGWPPKTHTCQCTQCRKRSGALVSPWIDTTPSLVTWSSPSHPTTPSHPTSSKSPSPTVLPSFAEFSSAPGMFRGFCKTCGSPLTFRSQGSAEELEITTGSLDEEVLAGEMGKVLGRASDGHYFSKRVIEGVTDLEAGKRFKEGSGSEEVGGRG